MERRQISSRDTQWAKRLASLCAQRGYTPNGISKISIVFSLIGITLEKVRGILTDKNIADIAIPKQLKIIETFPLLGMGKPDFVNLQKLIS